MTHLELWTKAGSVYGQFIPDSTFRDWIQKFCLLEVKAEYEKTEVYWILKLSEIARELPKGSPRIKKKLHQMMREIENGSTIDA